MAECDLHSREEREREERSEKVRRQRATKRRATQVSPRLTLSHSAPCSSLSRVPPPKQTRLIVRVEGRRDRLACFCLPLLSLASRTCTIRVALLSLVPLTPCPGHARLVAVSPRLLQPLSSLCSLHPSLRLWLLDQQNQLEEGIECGIIISRRRRL